MAVIKQKQQGKLTASFRIDPEIMSELRKQKYPLSEVAEAGLLYFMNLSDVDKFIYLPTFDYDNIEIKNMKEMCSSEKWPEYTKRLLIDTSFKKLLYVNLSIDELLKELFENYLDQEHKEKITSKKAFLEIISDLPEVIESNFNKKYPDCPAEIKRALTKNIFLKFIGVALDDNEMWHFFKTVLLKSSVDNMNSYFSQQNKM